MPVIEATILSKVLDWLWIILSFGFVLVFRKLFKHDDQIGDHTTALALCEQRDKQYVHQRTEDRLLRDQQRQELMDRIDAHHEKVMDRLDKLTSA